VVTAATSVWVATNATIDTGYHTGGIEVIVDKESIRPGTKAPVMIVAPSNDRWVLFDVGADDFYDVRLLHLDGTTKLVELPLDEKHIPNVFLTATTIADRQLFTSTKEIIVPPVQQFLDVSVIPDNKEHLPRDKGRFTVTTRDAQGRPVSAEVALGVVDQAVYAIQSDYAGDPRQFFYGTKRQNQLTLSSSFNERQYVRFVLGKKQLPRTRRREGRAGRRGRSRWWRRRDGRWNVDAENVRGRRSHHRKRCRSDDGGIDPGNTRDECPGTPTRPRRTAPSGWAGARGRRSQ
jgi:hypothetical protein